MVAVRKKKCRLDDIALMFEASVSHSFLPASPMVLQIHGMIILVVPAQESGLAERAGDSDGEAPDSSRCGPGNTPLAWLLECGAGPVGGA